MKKKSKQILAITFILIALIIAVGYFAVQEIALGIPEGYIPAQLFIKGGQLQPPLGSGCSWNGNSFNCGNVWSDYSPVTYGYSTLLGLHYVDGGAYAINYNLPSDITKYINIPCQAEGTGRTSGCQGGYEVIDKNIVTTVIPSNVDVFEKQINNLKVNIQSTKEMPIHLIAYIHRKNTDLYWDVSKDINVKTGNNELTITMPQDLYIVSDPYELIIIPTYLTPATLSFHRNFRQSYIGGTASSCPIDVCTGSIEIKKYIQVGDKVTKTFVVSSLPPYRYKLEAESCPEYYVESVDSKNLCISVLPKRGCGEFVDGQPIGCPVLYDPIQKKDVPMLCTAEGRCTLPVGSGKTIDPAFYNTLAGLKKTEEDFKLPSIPLRKIDYNSPDIEWNKVRGFAVSGMTSCMPPNLDGEPIKCPKGITISLGNVEYISLGYAICKPKVSSDLSQGFNTEELVPFEYEGIKADGSLVQKGINVVNTCGSISDVKKYVLVQEECILDADCQTATETVLNLQANAKCVNYKCETTEQTEALQQQGIEPLITTTTTETQISQEQIALQKQSIFTPLNIILTMAILGLIIIIIVYRKRIFK